MTKAKSQFAWDPRVIRALRARQIYKLVLRELLLVDSLFLSTDYNKRENKQTNRASKRNNNSNNAVTRNGTSLETIIPMPWPFSDNRRLRRKIFKHPKLTCSLSHFTKEDH